MLFMRYYNDLKNSEYGNILMESDWLKSDNNRHIKFILVYNLEDRNYSIYVSYDNYPDITTLVIENIPNRAQAIDKFHHMTKYGYDSTIDRKKKKSTKPKSKRITKKVKRVTK